VGGSFVYPSKAFPAFSLDNQRLHRRLRHEFVGFRDEAYCMISYESEIPVELVSLMCEI
jgi:hypothetical protein